MFHTVRLSLIPGCQGEGRNFLVMHHSGCVEERHIYSAVPLYRWKMCCPQQRFDVPQGKRHPQSLFIDSDRLSVRYLSLL